jgi:threonyl-tRNA synthetase
VVQVHYRPPVAGLVLREAARKEQRLHRTMPDNPVSSRSPLVVEVKAGICLADAASFLGKEAKSTIVAARVGDAVCGLATVLDGDARVEFLTCDSPEGLEVYRHTAAHVMAQAVKRLFPDARLGIGPAIEDGFYYDFDLGGRLTEECLGEIECKMNEIVGENLGLERVEMTRDEAIKFFAARGETYKVDLLQGLEEPKVTVYKQGDYADLCRGPHLPATGCLRAFKLTGLAGAYWRGDESKPMLQRVYGTAFATAEEVKAHLARLEEAKKRDHRRLGTDLDLFSVCDEAGPGLAYWHAKGSIVRNAIEDFWRAEHIKRGYQLVFTPHIARSGMWKASGHLDYYKDNMYLLRVENDEYVLKPMNCVGHILIYKSRKRSYRDLPIRMAELGTVYRRERSGTLHGLMRVRGFTQDDAHIFCTREQIVDEIIGVIELAQFMLATFGFPNYEVNLSVRDPAKPQDYAGEDCEWCEAEKGLVEALTRKRIPYIRKEGEAVFYGPKIDIKLLDALGRGWQGPTIQFDFNLSRRLGVEYVGSDGQTHNVVMIHRTVLGAMERFMATLVEHYAGAMPMWLAPVQVSILPVLAKNEAYAAGVLAALVDAGVRAEVLPSDEKLGYRIREATLAKVPYILVVGDKEEQTGLVAVRKRKEGDKGQVPLAEFVRSAKSDIDSKRSEA